MILVHKLSVISKNSWKFTRNRLTHPGLTNAAYDVCGIIYQSESTNQDNISKALKMDKSSVAKVVNKCVEDGLIERRVNPSNRREYILTLTEEGMKTVQELVDLVEQWQQEALSVLSEEEKELFLNSVLKLVDKTNEMCE
ncbi:MAG: MarR family transcriptional regulator [Erysipelotrichaceae bacterium]|nr:MarR family transcriptional regulator [Erysipelotrichaceae bacterium]MBQ7888359.1 MarR family transcriptional regulator [Erysipelotrichaceae bacterium]